MAIIKTNELHNIHKIEKNNKLFTNQMNLNGLCLCVKCSMLQIVCTSADVLV